MRPKVVEKLASFRNSDKIDYDALDPERNPGITMSGGRHTQLSCQVAFARNWYIEVYKHRRQGEIPWESKIDCLFCNDFWNFSDASKNHHGSEDDVDLAPEEYIDHGEIYVAEDWIRNHEQYCLTKASSPAMEKFRHMVYHVKSITRSRSTSQSGSSHAGSAHDNSPSGSSPPKRLQMTEGRLSSHSHR